MGIVGPASQACETQTWFNDMICSAEPLSWDLQLSDEPLLNIGYDVAHLLVERDLGSPAEFRLIPVGAVAVGNYFAGASLGRCGEVGWKLVDAFGISSLRGGFDSAASIGVGPVQGWSLSFCGSVSAFGSRTTCPSMAPCLRKAAPSTPSPFWARRALV